MRSTLNCSFELKSVTEAGSFEGYGSVFGNVDLGGDVVAPGAFKDTLRQHEQDGVLPQMFWMHQPDQVPGRWLSMSEDSRGLYVRGMLADTVLGKDTRTLLLMKAIRGLSIGYSIEDHKSDVSYEGGARVLKKVNLWEVSLVSLPMNPSALVEAAKHGGFSNGGHSDSAELLDSIARLTDSLIKEIVR
jgi:HK97 family phage prohead protease